MEKIFDLLKEKVGEVPDEVRDLIEGALNEAVSAEVAALKAKNGELLSANKKLRQQLASGSGGDALALERELEELKEKYVSEKTTLERETAKLTRELEKARKIAEQESQAVSQLLVDKGLAESLVRVGVKPEFMPAVSAMLKSQVKVVAEGDKRLAVLGDKPLEEAVKEWAASDSGKVFVVAPANAGGGANGSGPQGGTGVKTMKRVEFEQLSPANQQAFILKEGGKVID